MADLGYLPKLQSSSKAMSDKVEKEGRMEIQKLEYL